MKNIEVEEKSSKRIWSEDEIKNLIQTNDKVLYGALKKLYACQTEDERNSDCTKVYNGMGFNGVDAPILSSFLQISQQDRVSYPQTESYCP